MVSGLVTKGTYIFYNNLPVIIVDSDFYEYLESWAFDSTVDIGEFAEIWDMWVADND